MCLALIPLLVYSGEAGGPDATARFRKGRSRRLGRDFRSGGALARAAPGSAARGRSRPLPASALENKFGGYWRTRAYTNQDFSGEDDESLDNTLVDFMKMKGDAVDWKGYRLEVLSATQTRAERIRIGPGADRTSSAPDDSDE